VAEYLASNTVYALLGQLYADDIHASLHCLAYDAMADRAMTFAAGARWPGCHQIDCGSIHLRPNASGWAQLAKLDLAAIAASFPHIAFLVTVRDLGVKLTFAPHINRLCYYQLRTIRTIFRSLTSAATAALVHTFVAARLDYSPRLSNGLSTTPRAS